MRGAAFAGLAAASAALAHGDARDPRWLAVALAGAMLATAVLAAAGALAGRRLPTHTAAPLGAVTAAMLAAQSAAHAALLAAGAPSHAGLAGGLALHVVLAVISAVLVRGIDLRVASVSAGSGSPPSLAATTARIQLAPPAPRAAFAVGASRGRAPPEPA
jgi:hypothetical protein